MKQETGIRIIATFDDRAISLSGAESGEAGSRSRNEGINMLPAIDGQAQPLATSSPAPEVATIIARIESALEVIHAGLAEIKQIQNKAG